MATDTKKILVIGAGPAGIISASILNKKGYDVTVIEKQHFPRFVIGESLLPRCMEQMDKAGLLDAVKQTEYQEKYGAIFYRDNKTCDFDFSNQHTAGWKWAYQVPRADFDKTLADEAERQGVTIHYGTSVEDVKIDESSVTTTVKTEKGDNLTFESEYIVDGSGYGRVLPKLFDLDKPSDFPLRKAFFTHVKEPNRPKGPESSRITAYSVNDDLWIWSIPFSNGVTSVGFVGEPSFFEEINDENREQYFRNFLELAPTLCDRFKDLEYSFEPRLLTGFSCGVTRLYGDRYVLTGNSTEFLDPIFSSGVTFAMESGAKAAELIDKELQNEAVDWDIEYKQYIEQGVDTFRSYVKAWYSGDLQKIFFADEINDQFKTQICSVLAGYVWDKTNPFVKKHNKILQTLSQIISKKLA